MNMMTLVMKITDVYFFEKNLRILSGFLLFAGYRG